MGFLKKVFGGKDKEQPPRRTPPPARPGRPAPTPATPPPPPVPGVAVEQMDVKGLLRVLGSGNPDTRQRAAQRLKEMRERQAIRPLMTAYMNYGDPGVLEALASFGTDVVGPASSEAFDLSVMGARRARLMDVLGMTGDESAIPVVRDFVDDRDSAIHVRATTALARLGDLTGIDRLSLDLQQATDVGLRTLALRALRELGDVRGARQAIAGHVERYLAEGGAIPKEIGVVAPRLADPDVSMYAFIVEEIRNTPHHMLLVTGSGAGELARARQADLRRELAGHDLYLLTPELAPEEQMNLLEEARDVAARIPEHTTLVIGVVPAPNDSPPLRHFLTTGPGGQAYSAKIVFVDPHEYGLLMDWWRYVDERAEVATDFEVFLSEARPGEKSAISEEEYLIYELATEAQRAAFPRALLAHF